MFVRTKYSKANGFYNYSEFVCDSEEDIANLPTTATGVEPYGNCAVGSLAFVAADGGKHFILNNQNEWVEYNAGGGGGVTNINVDDDGEGNVFVMW